MSGEKSDVSKWFDSDGFKTISELSPSPPPGVRPSNASPKSKFLNRINTNTTENKAIDHFPLPEELEEDTSAISTKADSKIANPPTSSPTSPKKSSLRSVSQGKFSPTK